jgi:hypothetical protein
MTILANYCKLVRKLLDVLTKRKIAVTIRKKGRKRRSGSEGEEQQHQWL